MIKIELLKKIPNDIIINNIFPYTYIKKCPKHLQDIRSFYSHFSLVENYYYIYYNEHILFNDLEEFFYKNDEIYSITNKYYKIFKRHIMFQDIQHINISNYLYLKFHSNVNNPNNKIKFIWGLLTPNERVNFIYKHVLE
jgi:hypothetical protein